MVWLWLDFVFGFVHVQDPLWKLNLCFDTNRSSESRGAIRSVNDGDDDDDDNGDGGSSGGGGNGHIEDNVKSI